MQIDFTLDHQVIKRTDNNKVVALSKNYLTAKFTPLTDDWAAPITAIFGKYTVLLDKNNECYVPWEVLQNVGKVTVSAFCGNLHTANETAFFVQKSGYISGQTPTPPSPDIYSQISVMAQDAKETADSVRADADAGKFNGEPGKPGPQGEPGPAGRSPVIRDGSWWVYDDDSKDYVDTGVSAGGSGNDGQDGFSPIAAVEQTESGATITITDQSGTTTAIITNGKDGAQGTQGEQGPQGLAGANGADGYTPQRGVDYWTEADKQYIVSATVKALPVYNGEVQEVG